MLWLTLQDEDMREVVNWISENVPFDRLYFYGSTEEEDHGAYSNNKWNKYT